METGWLPDTPVGDTVLRRFLFNQAEANAAMAVAAGGRAEDTDDVALADSGGPVAYFNEAILRRPLTGVDDPVLDQVDRFFAADPGRTHMLLSIWPTPDLAGRGWFLVGHPAFVVRGAFPAPHTPGPGVEVLEVRDPVALRTAERIAIEGYPIEGAEAGTVLPSGILDTGLLFRLGLLEGEPVGSGARYVGHGVVNLCFGATLPAARRRGVWEALVWARVADAPDLPAVAYTSDDSRPGFERMGFVPTIRFTLWGRVQ